MAIPDITAMGIYVDHGRNLRGKLMVEHGAWIALGRTKFDTVDYPWSNEGAPPAESATDDEFTIDNEMTSPLGSQVMVPFKKATICAMVKEDVDGTIEFGSLTWKVSTEADAKHIYFKFIIEPEDFEPLDGTPHQGFPAILGYRRLEVHLGTVQNAQFASDLTSRRKLVLATTPGGSDLGRLLFVAHEVLQNRLPEERHVIEILLLA